MFVILGAGISGITAATLLAESGYPVTLIEQADFVGGLAATHQCFGLPVDVGSHRIHPGYHPEALKLVKELIKDDLIFQKRNGKILILDRYIDYPPNIISLLKGFGPKKFTEWGIDLIKSKLSFKNRYDNFEVYTQSKVGRSLYNDFYKPYALKLWNTDPSEIAIDPAKQRVRRLSLSSYLLKKFQNFNSSNNYYYYPRHGIGQIAEELKKRFIKANGNLLLNTRVIGISKSENKITGIKVINANNEYDIKCTHVLSTIPVKTIKKLISPNKFEESGLIYRSLKIIYLKINEPAKSLHETYYIPNLDYKIGRVSDIGKYYQSESDTRILTLEIPCSYGDHIATASDETLRELCAEELTRSKIISSPSVVKEIESIFVPEVYPIYKIGWKNKFSNEMKFINNIENLYHFGRTALFLHCNIDHCIYMAQATVQKIKSNCISDWPKLQESFLQFYIRE